MMSLRKQVSVVRSENLFLKFPLNLVSPHFPLEWLCLTDGP